MRTAKTERNREIARLYETGDWTLQEIGDRYGITRERVRQIVRKQGVEGSPYREKRREERITDCAVCGEPFDPVRYYEGSQGGRRVETCSSGCGETLRKRRSAEATTIWSAEDALNVLIDLAVDLGHTPRERDVNDSGESPTHMCYVHLWGSMAAAQEAAGLVPNERGHPPKPLPAHLNGGS